VNPRVMRACRPREGSAILDAVSAPRDVLQRIHEQLAQRFLERTE
jgi:hypothetical protein